MITCLLLTVCLFVLGRQDKVSCHSYYLETFAL